MLTSTPTIIIRYRDGDRRRFYPPSGAAQREAVRRIETRELYAGNRIVLWRGVTVDADDIDRIESN